MIVDIFSYNGEADLLELRLNMLDKVVDEFIVCEGDETTSGYAKLRYFEQDKERFKPWLHKIKYFIMAPYTDVAMTALAEKQPLPSEHWWRREFIQKESMRFALTHLKGEDRVFIGDVDEIWNPDITYPEGRLELQQIVYAYSLDNRSSEFWTGTSVMSYNYIKEDTLDNLRAYDDRRAYMKAPVLPNAGWHFTNMGGKEFIKRKIKSYAHQEFNQEAILNNVEQNIKENKDYLGRNFTFTKDESELPSYLLENKDKYLHLFKV